jgi:hypothetical protein
MIAELKAVERIKSSFSESAFSQLAAKIVMAHLKKEADEDEIITKSSIYRKVNECLKSYRIKPVTYEFIKKNIELNVNKEGKVKSWKLKEK